MSDFLPGLKLAEAFYDEVVAPILSERFPSMKYSAALIGSGSEVLGFDDAMSTDHYWGARVMLFLNEGYFETAGDAVRSRLAENLPGTFMGHSTHWSPPDPDDGGVQKPVRHTGGPVNHRCEIFAIGDFLKSYLGTDIRNGIAVAGWLSFPHQKLRSLVAGGVFRDDLGLAAIRKRLAWYPSDVWRYVLACSWARIGDDEHLAGRAGMVGDEAGSAIIAVRLVREVMRLCFLMEKDYPPYPKWFGTAFKNLKCASELLPVLEGVLHAPSWQQRDGLLADAYRVVARMHNTLGLTDPVPDEPSLFWNRPFTVIHGDRYADALISTVADPEVRTFVDRNVPGSIDLVSDSTAVLEGFHGQVLYR